jgi:hypothetical protein
MVEAETRLFKCKDLWQDSNLHICSATSQRVLMFLTISASLDREFVKLFPSSIYVNFFCRGLLLPKVVVDDLGGTRTDAGMLGHGIYFADSAR